MVPLETAVTRVGDGPSPQFPQCPADRDRHPAEGGWTEMSTDTPVGCPDHCAIVGAGRVGDALPATVPVLLCVPDAQIAVAARTIPPGRLVGHTSGATTLDALAGHEAF